MREHLDVIGVVVTILTFFILFFGFVTIPASASVAGAVLIVGFVSAGAGLVAQLVFNAIYTETSKT